ncbi:MAG: imidazole glycerol phosphate synthase subunit HisH [Acidimicrobiia bacterium]
MPGPLVAVLDYGIGNLRSAEKALRHVGADARLTADAGLVADADGVVLPGVGNFGACMRALGEHGLVDAVHAAVASGRPFLAICVGLQLLYERSEESPGVAGLGVLPGEVRWLPDSVRRPQMQWNRLRIVRPDPALEGIGDAPWMYFVHSLAVAPSPHGEDDVIATCDYGGDVVAAVRRGNVLATQFHPEKSAEDGLRILSQWVGSCAGARVP